MGGKSKNSKKKLPSRKSESDTENGSENIQVQVDALHSCCLPIGLDCLCPQSPAEDDDQSVRLVCSSDKCTLSKMTHPRCFKKLEDLGVTTLKNIKGRAREWSDKERLRYLWQDRAYELIMKVLKCPCGQGYLRKDGDLVQVDGVAAVPADVDKKKRKKQELPKLNVSTNALSQKGVGQYFKDANCQPKVVKPKKPKKDEEPKVVSKKKYIPGLITEDVAKPQKLNIDLDSYKCSPEVASPFVQKLGNETNKAGDIRKQPTPRPLMELDIFESEDEDDEIPFPRSNSNHRSSFGVIGSQLAPIGTRSPQFLPNTRVDCQSPQSPFQDQRLNQGFLAEAAERSTRSAMDLQFLATTAASGPSSHQQSLNQGFLVEPSDRWSNNSIENVRLLRENVNLRQENNKLKEIILKERKQFYDAFSFQIFEIKKREIEHQRILEMSKKENLSIHFLRDIILESAAVADGLDNDSDEESFVEDILNDPGSGGDTPATDFSDSGVSENEVFQVNQKLEELDSASTSMKMVQNKTDLKLTDLDCEVKKLAGDNQKFRKDIEKLRNYLKFFDLF